MKMGDVVSFAAAIGLMIALQAGATAEGAAKTCDGFGGVNCGADQFCQHKPGQCYGFDASGTCTVKPRFCPQITGPKFVVCGCNGQTFPNDCIRRQAGVSLAHKGACP